MRAHSNRIMCTWQPCASLLKKSQKYVAPQFVVMPGSGVFLSETQSLASRSNGRFYWKPDF